jgi:hypothetical protein
MATTIRSSMTVTFVCALLLLAGTAVMRAGGALETFDITGLRPSPIPGHVLARVIGIKWDVRSIPVKYSMNNTLDPIPNPLGPPVLTLAAAQAELQASLNAWNDIPTSFIRMDITNVTSNPGLVGFDMINELSFRTAAGFTAIASSPSVSLIQDVTLEDGDLIDNDADADVSDDITVATDVDGDGDLEFPAGFYKAGTILDNDVQFNTKTSNGLRFTVDPAQADTVARSVDLAAVAVHEFGHSHGLSHSLNNQNSRTDGNGATMFPFIDTGDPAAELAQRSLDIDDIAYSSHFYREGTATSGPAALQAGDVAFKKAFGIITGDLHHAVLNEPIAGGHVFTIDDSTKTASSGAYSGTVDLSFNPANGGLFFIPRTLGSMLVDGKYEIPVPKGKYSVHIEAVDGAPAAAGNISFTTQVGAFLGQQNFNEEQAENDEIRINPGQTKSHVDLMTSADINIDNFGNRNFIGFINTTGNHVYAVRVPAEQIAAIGAGKHLRLKGMAYDTSVVDASVPAVFAEAVLTTGRVNADGSLSLNTHFPLARVPMFLGQDNDFAPFAPRHGELLGALIQLGVKYGFIENLFIVLRNPAGPPFAGVSNQPPLIGLDGGVAANDVPIFGFSYLSADGGATFTQRLDFNFRFSLRFEEITHHDDDH